MNRYERYKDSGIPWLGEVPEHWEVKRLKFMLSEKLKYGANESAESDEPEQPRYIRITDIDEQGNLKDDTFKSLEFEKAKDYLLNVNDILLARSGATVGKSFLYKENLKNFACYAGYLIRARLDQKKFNANFVNYYFQSTGYWDWIKSVNIQATIQNVSAEKYNDFVLSVPTLIEQTAIAHYLDTKLGEIDALIDKQQTLIEKLAEQRTAVITHAVTKGLTPAAPMKKSGVEWLGDVPAHWETWKITHAIDLIGSGTTPKSDNAEYYDGDILWVTTSELRENFISDTKQKVSDSAIKEYSALKIYPVNSVAMAMYGATIGRLGILEREATFNQACCVFGNSKILHYKFLFYWLWHRRPILISLSNGGGQPNLSQDDLRKLKIPIPSYEEQINIAEYLDQETVKIDRLCETVNQTIGRLKEYRTALITQVVTGKIKVTDE